MEKLVASGAQGQCEGSRLVATWSKPAVVNWRPYDNPPEVYQKAIHNAMESVAQAERPWQYNAWYPSGTQGHPGPAWRAMGQYEPSWARPNTARLWDEKVIKNAHGQPIGWRKEDPQPAPWKPSWGMGGARRRSSRWQ